MNETIERVEIALENDLVTWYKKADAGGYAIPHFNCADCWDVMAILQAADEEESPVIIATIPKVLELIDPLVFGGMGMGAIKKARYPVFLHLDHSNSVELCKTCVDSGYTSVMIDGSRQPLVENIRMSKAVADYAHTHGVCVEAEIGKIKGRGYEGTFEGDDFLVQVDDAVELVKRTNVDSLAIGIGTAHGFYQGKPEINFQRLKEVNKALELPLVLHGGTGIPKEDVRRAIREGINKVNVGTQIRFTNVSTFHQLHLSPDYDPNMHSVDLAAPVVQAVKEVAKQWIRVCMSNKKA